MSNSTTEQKATSQDKSIIQGIGFKEFSSICQEYQIVEKATKELLEIANDKNTPVRTKVDIYKWVIEMNVGKPRQISEEETKEEQGIQRYVMEVVSQDRVMMDLIKKVGGMENILQALKDKGYQDIPDLSEYNNKLEEEREERAKFEEQIQ